MNALGGWMKPGVPAKKAPPPVKATGAAVGCTPGTGVRTINRASRVGRQVNVPSTGTRVWSPRKIPTIGVPVGVTVGGAGVSVGSIMVAVGEATGPSGVGDR